MKILLATDGSEFSERAAQFLTRLRWSRSDSITAFHALYAVPFHADEKFYHNTLAAIKKDIAPRILDSTADILKSLQAVISVEIDEFSPGRSTPGQCIVDAAEASGADLIVLGARGIKGVASVFLGSETRRVAIHSPKPVLVVNRKGAANAGAMKILFAADGSDSSRAAGELLTALPFPGDAELTVLHVIPASFSDIPERYLLEMDERVKESVAGARAGEFAESEKILEEARKSLSATYSHCAVLSKVGDPSAEILKAAADMNADVIALGGGLRGIRGMLGSVSRNILSHAASSVLIGKAGKASP